MRDNQRRQYCLASKGWCRWRCWFRNYRGSSADETAASPPTSSPSTAVFVEFEAEYDCLKLLADYMNRLLRVHGNLKALTW
jgi:hypothetical protein